jgi:hypothetical protein
MTEKLIGFVAGLGVICAVGLGAQTSETKTETKTKVKGGREITTTGCVERMPDGRYGLTGIAGGGTQYVLTGRHDVAKHVGHRVEISGKATDLGDARLRTETKTKFETEDGKSHVAHAESEQKGDLTGLPLLGVKSVKMLAKSCS